MNPRAGKQSSRSELVSTGGSTNAPTPAASKSDARRFFKFMVGWTSLHVSLLNPYTIRLLLGPNKNSAGGAHLNALLHLRLNSRLQVDEISKMRMKITTPGLSSENGLYGPISISRRVQPTHGQNGTRGTTLLRLQPIIIMP